MRVHQILSETVLFYKKMFSEVDIQIKILQISFLIVTVDFHVRKELAIYADLMCLFYGEHFYVNKCSHVSF